MLPRLLCGRARIPLHFETFPFGKEPFCVRICIECPVVGKAGKALPDFPTEISKARRGTAD